MEQSEGFYKLSPHDVLNATEEAGFFPTGEMQQLNSYENRVFLIALENKNSAIETPLEKIVVKAYRPNRWSLETILEEHEFLYELQNEGLQTAPPFIVSDNLEKTKTVITQDNIHFAFFPRIQGRLPQEFLNDDLKKVGRSIAQIHNIGSRKVAKHRPTLTCQYFGDRNINILEKVFEPSLWPRYKEAAYEILDFLDDHLEPEKFIRIHGDCHRGNLIHKQAHKIDEFFFLDFDDFINGPVAQDFWMLFSASDILEEEKQQILEGYEELRNFPKEQFKLFTPLRGLRIIQYSAWITSRWQDPSFPQLFPDFNTFNYWAEETEALEKIARSLISEYK